jgi:hypothetical protein
MAVVWLDDEHAAPAAGQLALRSGHAALEGATGGSPRQFDFDASEVEAVELVAESSARLHGRPTLAIALRNRGRVLVAEVVGFGVAAEIVDYLAHWQDHAD